MAGSRLLRRARPGRVGWPRARSRHLRRPHRGDGPGRPHRRRPHEHAVGPRRGRACGSSARRSRRSGGCDRWPRAGSSVPPPSPSRGRARDVAGLQHRPTGATATGSSSTGAKAWISNLDLAAFIVTFATRDRSAGRRGISAFVIPSDTPGLVFRPFQDKLGFRSISTGEVVLDGGAGARTTACSATRGQGFAVAMAAVESGRLAVAARAVGVAQSCLDDSLAYASQREVFGQPIAHYQLIQAKVADMAVGVPTARLLVHAAARLWTGANAPGLSSAWRSSTPATSSSGPPPRPSRSTAPTGRRASYRVAALLPGRQGVPDRRGNQRDPPPPGGGVPPGNPELFRVSDACEISDHNYD